MLRFDFLNFKLNVVVGAVAILFEKNSNFLYRPKNTVSFRGHVLREPNVFLQVC